MKVCSSCNIKINKDFVEFKCPKCAKDTIIRCKECRANSKPYSCKECGFTGP